MDFKYTVKLDNGVVETGHRQKPDTVHKNKVQMDTWFTNRDWYYKQIGGARDSVFVRFIENGEIFDHTRDRGHYEVQNE